MKKQLVVTLLVLFGVIAAQCGGPAATQAPAPTPTQAAPEQPPAALDGKALLQEHCTVCHDLTRVESKNKSEADWKATVERMVSKGAKLNPAEQEAVIKYLAATYPQ
jgi:cytochrome c5